MTFDYGSRHDLQVLGMDLSDEAADKIRQFLQAKSPGIKLRDVPFFVVRRALRRTGLSRLGVLALNLLPTESSAQATRSPNASRLPGVPRTARSVWSAGVFTAAVILAC